MNKYFCIYGFYCRIFLAIILFTGCATSRKAERASKATEEAKEKEIKEKYAAKLGVNTTDISNYPLYSFIDSWYGAPYHYAGHSKSGVDCSDFVSILYQQVYGKSLSGTASDMCEQCASVKKSKLQEGDLVFFKINSKNISHVGIYLQNNKFIHASVHSGVVISDLDETYYKEYYYKAGRLKN
ncbi:MAG: C40 family peptidase [Bacteroidia bacterium]